MSSASYSTRTEGKSNIDTITWSVANFKNLLKHQVGQKIPVIKSEGQTGHFELKIQFPRHRNDIFEIYCFSPNTVCLDCYLIIQCDADDDKPLLEIENIYCNVQANKWQYLVTIVKEKINVDGSGIIKCEFNYQVTTNDIFDNFNIPEPQLSDDFENLLNNGLFSDVIMKSAEGREFKLHKSVLVSRSAVLKAHFEHNTTECHTNTIESPLDTDVLREILTFIYSDKAPRVDEIPEELLAAADYYQLNRLKCLCEKPLYEKLTIESAIETLQLADLHSADTLKQLTLQFIKDSPISLITKTKAWSTLKSLELVKTICEYATADNFDPHIVISQE